MKFAAIKKQVKSGLMITATAVTLVACAAVPQDPEKRAAYDELNDPLEPMNRVIFDFNDAVDEAVLEPVAIAYKNNTHEFIQGSVDNFMGYLRLPVTFMAQVLQGEFDYAGDTVGRFLFNTITFGFTDMATDAGIPDRKADFGQTFAKWGFSEGPYVVVPFLGPFTARSGVGQLTEFAVSPVSRWEGEEGNGGYAATHIVLDTINWRAKNIENIRKIKETSLDYYATVRSAYRQQRRQLAGETTVKELDNQGAEIFDQEAELFDFEAE